MNDRAQALLLVLAAILTGCGAAPAATPRAATAMITSAPRESAKAEASRAVHPDAPAAPNALAALAVPLEPPPPEGAACRPETARGATGFYATDTWTPGEVVLTFDDGPHPTGTPRVLDQLAKHGMPATFFVVGRAISRDTYPLVQRIVADGHTLGTHSYSHDVDMTRVHAPAATHDDILGQHRVTTILVDLALLATSGDDFDAMFVEVFASSPSTWLPASAIRRDHPLFSGRHAALLDRRGPGGGARPHDVVLSRPPGGGPYVEHDGAAGMALHDAALAELSLVNVMWHDASGDTDPARRGDFAYLTANIERAARNGGVLLVHDYIRPDALAHALASIARRPDVRVVSIEEATRHKFGCGVRDLAATLRREAASRAAR